MKILTLNVCGIRASQKKGLFRWLSKQKVDFICLQEVRATNEQISFPEFDLKEKTKEQKEVETKTQEVHVEDTKEIKTEDVKTQEIKTESELIEKEETKIKEINSMEEDEEMLK